MLRKIKPPPEAPASPPPPLPIKVGCTKEPYGHPEISISTLQYLLRIQTNYIKKTTQHEKCLQGNGFSMQIDYYDKKKRAFNLMYVVD